MPKCEVCKVNQARYTIVLSHFGMNCKNTKIRKSFSESNLKSGKINDTTLTKIMPSSDTTNIGNDEDSKSLDSLVVEQQKLCINCYHAKQNKPY